MKQKIVATLLLLMILIIGMAGCSSGNQSSDSENTYQKISSEEAKKMMDEESNLIILDVRTAEEFETGHIQGAVNISNTEITATAEKAIPDKSATILVYCRSGNRSALASKELSELGYSHIYDLGGLVDWKYEIITE
jgi:rhodanese-related sulfurtransferase